MSSGSRASALGVLLAICALQATRLLALTTVSGPLRVEDLYPAILPFLAVPAEGPGAPRGVALSLATTYGNDFHRDPMLRYPELEILIDAEVLRLTLAAAWGLSRGISLEARLSLVGEYGGFLDQAIEGFHDFFQLPNAGRGDYPAYHCSFRIVNDGQVMVDLEGPFWALGDLIFSGKWTLLDGQARGFGVALQAALSLPVRSDALLTTSGQLNASLGALASWRCAPFAAFGGVRYLYFGEPAWGSVLGFRPHNLGFFLCLEWSRSANLAWLLQADGMSLPYLHPHPWLSGLAGPVSFGARFRVSPKLLLELHLSEELFSFATLDIAAGCVARLAL